MRTSPVRPSKGLWACTLFCSLILHGAHGGFPCESSGHPKIALMFLTRSGLLHKDLWELWLRSAANLTDASYGQHTLCTREHQRNCEREQQPSYPFGQKLFSVYIHSSANPHIVGSTAAQTQLKNTPAELRDPNMHLGVVREAGITSAQGQPKSAQSTALEGQLKTSNADSQLPSILLGIHSKAGSTAGQAQPQRSITESQEPSSHTRTQQEAGSIAAQAQPTDSLPVHSTGHQHIEGMRGTAAQHETRLAEAKDPTTQPGTLLQAGSTEAKAQPRTTDAAFLSGTQQHSKGLKAIEALQGISSTEFQSGGQQPVVGSQAAEALATDGFAQFQIPSSIMTAWGQPSLIQAERLLLQNALLDPDNQRFVLLSESCIPLYPPQLIYQQLMGELRSRINACRNWRGTDDHVDRWAMVKSSVEKQGMDFVDWDEWRYSSQWKSLNRKHADLVASDYAIHPLFEAHCHFTPNVTCISDEHYVPTLLAHLGQEGEVDCLGYLTYNTWDPDKVALMSVSKHEPVDFKPTFITPAMIHGMRTAHCSSNQQHAITRAADMYTQGVPPQDHTFCFQHIGSYLNSSLHYSCHLFGRKFGPQAVEKVLHLVSGSNCLELGILAPELCSS